MNLITPLPLCGRKKEFGLILKSIRPLTHLNVITYYKEFYKILEDESDIEATIEMSCDRQDSYQQGTIIFDGEVGVGKTRLLEEIKAFAQFLGINVFFFKPTQNDADFLNYILKQIKIDSIPISTHNLSESLYVESAQVKLFEELFRKIDTPAIICIDDCHLLDNLSIELISYLSRIIRYGYTQNLNIQKAEELSERGEIVYPQIRIYCCADLNKIEPTRKKLFSSPIYKIHKLNNLTYAEVELLVKSIIHIKEEDEDLIKWFFDTSYGNPLILEQILINLLNDEFIKFDGTKFYLTINIKELKVLNIKTNLDSLFSESLKSLTSEEIQLLRILALLDYPIPSGFLEKVTDLSGRIYDIISNLTDKGFIYFKSHNSKMFSYEFYHSRLKEILVKSLPEDKVHEIHIKLAEKMLEVSEDGVDEAEFVAHHYYLGGDYERALPYFYEAAKKQHTSLHYDIELKILKKIYEIIKLIQKDVPAELLRNIVSAFQLTQNYNDAIDFINSLPLADLKDYNILRDLKTSLAQCYEKSGDFNRAINIYNSLMKEFEYDTKSKVEFLKNIVSIQYKTQDFDEAIRNAEKGIQEAFQLKDKSTLGFLQGIKGIILYKTGNYSEAEENLQMAIRYVTDEEMMINCLATLGFIYHILEKKDLAEETFGKLFEILTIIQDNKISAKVFSDIALFFTKTGFKERSLKYTIQALNIHRRTSNIKGVMLTLFTIAKLYKNLGDYRNHLNSMSEILSFPFEYNPEISLLARFNIIHTLLEFGFLIESEELVKQSEEIINHIQNSKFVDTVNVLRAWLMFEKGDISDAKNFLSEIIHRERKDFSDENVQVGHLLYCQCLLSENSLEEFFRIMNEMIESIEMFAVENKCSMLLMYYLTKYDSRLDAILSKVKCEREKEAKGDNLSLVKILLCEAVKNFSNDNYETANKICLDCLSLLKKVAESLPEKYESSSVNFKIVKNVREVMNMIEAKKRNEIMQEIKPEQKDKIKTQNKTRQRLKLVVNLLREENRNLSKLMEINAKITEEQDTNKLLSFIVDSALELTNASHGFLILIENNATKVFATRHRINRGADIFYYSDIPAEEWDYSKSILNKVISERKSLITSYAIDEDEFKSIENIIHLQLMPVLCVPLKTELEVLGVLYIENRLERDMFTEIDRQILEAFADQVVIALENAKLIHDLNERHKELTKSLEEISRLNEELTKRNRELEKQVQRQIEELEDLNEIISKRVTDLQLKYRYENIIGRSEKMSNILKLLDKITDSQLPVLIEGESGTGKELIARAIHFNSRRKGKPFVAENCAALPENLLESELFGYMKGAFTGADMDKPGLIEIANGGTLFLDEIGEISQDLQKKLLRVLETSEFRRIGGRNNIKVSIRLVCATNKKLKALVEQGKFREDLFYRLNVFYIDLPPLRERKEDIPLLAEYFMQEFSLQTKTPKKKISHSAMQLLIQYDWPGNIRQLKNVLLGVISLSNSDTLTAEDFVRRIPVFDRRSRRGKDLEDKSEFQTKISALIQNEQGVAEKKWLSIDDYTKNFIIKYQDKYSDTELARLLGITRKTLWEKRKKWNLQR